MERVAHFAFRWRGRIVLAAAVITIAAAAYGSSVFDAVKPFGFQDPKSESSRADDAVRDATGSGLLPDVVLLVRPAGGVDNSRGRTRVAAAGRELARVSGIGRVLTPAQNPELLARDGASALITGWVTSPAADAQSVGADVEQRFAGDDTVEVGGAAVTSDQLNKASEDDLRRIELLAAPILLLLSLVLFRGAVAALLPVAVGGVSIVATLALLRLLTEFMDVDVFAINIVSGLGLGLAIDYSLFIVSRYRHRLEIDGPTERAVTETVRSLGPMIAFSGLIVAAALAALIVFPQRFLYSIGVGGALVALNCAFVSIVGLPALLALLGERVNALAPARLRRRPTGERWRRIAEFDLRNPVPTAVAVVAAMLLIALPALKLKVTRADATQLPPRDSAHRVDDGIDSHFARDPSSALVIVRRASAADHAPPSDLRRLRAQEGVVAISRPVQLDPDLQRIDVKLSVKPYSQDALDAVVVARSLNWGAPTLVGGPPAELKDERASLGDHLPLAAAIILVTSFLILFIVTRSVLLPVIALLMNALTLAVAFGVLVFVFQDGRLQGLLNYNSQSALDASMPILMFAVVFGLSTDYGVFLLSRIREARYEGAGGPKAIALGLQRSGQQITAAAILFAVAMGAFAFSDIVSVKEVAIGTAVAVLVDAMVVRPLLFPALLRIAGPAAWWAPRSMRP